MADSHNNAKSHRPFYLAKLTLILYVCLVIYATITPFNFVGNSPLTPWAWVMAPVPRYIPIFDVLSNVIGYLPFGFLMIFTIFPYLRKWWALLFTVIMGLAFSGTLESLQTYLPTRIPSPIDWYSNALGVLIGALFAIPLSPEWLSGNSAERLRSTYFGQYQGFFLLMMLCPIAQIYPQNAWLGMGDLGLWGTRISPYWDFPLNNASQEILITAISSYGIGVFFLFGMRKQVASLKIITILFIVMATLKVLISQFQFSQTGIFHWWSLSLGIGLALGCVFIYLASYLQKKYQWYLALMALGTMILMVNLLPYNPYFVAQLEQLPQGYFTHVNGMLGWIATVWPFLAIYLLLKSRHNDLK